MFSVYLPVISFLLFLDIMQTLLNTYNSWLRFVWQKLFTASKLWLFASLALLLLTGSFNQVRATVTIGTDYVIIGGTNTTANGTYYTNIANSSANKGSFSNISLGSFDRGTGSLTLSAQATTSQSGNDAVQSVQLFYRVYVAGTTAPTTYTALNLSTAASTGNGSNQSTTWTASVSPPNLLTATSAGTYTLDLYFQIISANKQGVTTSYFDRTNLNPYQTSFVVTGTPAATWVGNTTDWFTDSNWSPAGVPSSTTDATITLQAGVTNYPVVTGLGGRVAKVRTLRIDNSSSTSIKILTLRSGELQVYGDLRNPNNGLTQLGGILTLAGTTQTFDGGSFQDLRIQGGGTKTLTNRMDITNSLTFFDDGGIIVTRSDNTALYNIDLGTTANVVGETETSFVLGILRAPYRVITRSTTPYTFGGIGIELTSSPNSPTDPGSSVVTRRTGFAYTGVGTKSTSITRSFIFSELDSSDPQVYTLSFRYLNAELNGLSAASLAFYRSATSNAPFDALSRASYGSKTVISNTVTGTLAATFTLGETDVPLPVSLVSFTAVAQGADAVLNWTTASETNNQGFEVQVSTDGTNFSKLSFLAVNTPNSSTPHSYQYRDVTVGKQGTRYYRLRQLDLDGTESFVAPQAVTFNGVVAQGTSLQGYPSPFSSEINLAMQATAAGLAMVTVTDGVGRQVRTWQPTLAAGASSLRLAELQNMPAGLYIVQVRYNDGQTQRLKMVKE